MEWLLIAGLFALWGLITFKATKLIYSQNISLSLVVSPLLAFLYSYPFFWLGGFNDGAGDFTPLVAIPFGFLQALPFYFEIWAGILVLNGVFAYRAATNSPWRIASFV